MERYESMWAALRERIEEAQHAPINASTRETLQWCLNAMDLVWNDHRNMKEAGK
jgi:hypothetical protein